MVMSEGSAEHLSKIVDSRGRPISQKMANEINTARSRVTSAVAAELMWNDLFTDADRQRHDGDLDKCWRRIGTIRMWMQARGVSTERAVIEVANGLDLMSDKRANRLLRELGEEEQASLPEDRPFWDSSRGELRLTEVIIRRVRLLKNPSNIQLILDDFQDAGWPTRIPNPLDKDQHLLHLTVQSLNQGLKAIRFHGQEGGRAVTWTHLSS